MKHIFCVISPIILGLMAWELWHYEMQYRFGWASMEWLRRELWSPYVICLLPALSYMLPNLCWQRPAFRQLILGFGSLYLAGLMMFLFTEPFVHGLFGRFGFLVASIYYPILLFSLFFVSILFFIIKRHFLQAALPRWISVFVLLAFAAICPISIFSTIHFLNYGNAAGLVDAVKMGYPVFWTTVLLGWTAYFARLVQPMSD